MLFTDPQLKLLSEFFSDMAVVWFAAAFIAPVEPTSALKAAMSGFSALYFALSLAREVKS